MFWLWMSLVMGAGIGLDQKPQIADLSRDERLQKPVTLWVRIEPLPDVLKAVQKQTGVPFVCPDRLRNEKLAIFVEKRPAHEVLTQIAKVLRLRWETYGNGYRIERPAKEIQLEEEIRRVSDDARRQSITAYFDMLHRVAGMNPQQRQQRKEALEAKRAQPSSGGLSRLERAELSFLAAFDAAGLPSYRNIAKIFLASLPKQETQRLMNNQILTYSTHPAPGVALLPASLLDYYRAQLKTFLDQQSQEGPSEWEYLQEQEPTRLSLCYRLSPTTNRLLCQIGIEVLFKHAKSPPRVDAQIYYEGFGIPLDESALSQTQLYQEWASWAESSDALREWLRKRKPVANRGAFPPGWHSPPVAPTLLPSMLTAKFLELLAWRYGIPIIADSYRTAVVQVSNRANEGRWFNELLNQYWVRREGDYLLARRQRYWAWRRVEPVEAPLRHLETKFLRGETLTIDDYALIVASMDERTYNYILELAFFDYGPPIVVDFPPEPLRHLPLLRFWSTLTPTQRKALLQGEPLPIRVMNPTQRKMFAHAVEPFFPNPNRLVAPPNEEGYTPPPLRILYRYVHERSNFSESGVFLLHKPQRIGREILYHEDGVFGENVYILDSDQLDSDQIVMPEQLEERLVRKERYEGTAYTFRFQLLPNIFSDYQFVYFLPVKPTKGTIPQEGAENPKR